MDVKILGVLIVATLLLAGTNLAGLWSLPGGILSGDTLVLNPQYGTYSCVRDKDVYETNIPSEVKTGGWFGEQMWYEMIVTCPGNAASCKLGYKVKLSDTNSCLPPNIAKVDYHYINVYGVWGNTQTQYYTIPSSDNIIWFDKQFLPGESVHIGSDSGCSVVAAGSWILYGAKEYTTYHLVQEAANGYTAIANPDGCTVPFAKQPIGNDNIPPEICVDGCPQDKIGSHLDPNQYWSYLGGYTLSPSQTLYTYVGQSVYCQPTGSTAQIKNLKTIQTEGGTYLIPNVVIATKECCPGQTLGTATCGNDFMWYEQTPVECSFGTINSCDGAGSWVIDASDPARQTLKKATECDSNNQCVYTYATVECTMSSQCINPAKPVCLNYVCQASGVPPWTPTCGNGVCEAGEEEGGEHPCPPDCETLPYCGDGVCQVGEDPSNCPGDCPIASDFDWNLLWIIILAVLLGSLGYLLAGGAGALFGGIAGGIAGYAVYWFMSLAWWQQWLIGIAGVAGAGILLYVMIFGGGFLAVLALIVAMRGRDG